MYQEASDSPFVVKTFLKAHVNPRPLMIEDMKIQTLCKAFALEFNGLLAIEPHLDFIVTSCLQRTPKAGSDQYGPCVSLEPYIPGTYVKYNNNTTYVNPDLSDDFNQLVQAFSHFTFERSYGHLLVNDLQGVPSSRLLTDPAVQTRNRERFKLSDANLGNSGIKLFFVSHECNTYCQQLGLESDKTMFASGEFKFRESWPIPEPTVFCSNKLCRSIIRQNKAHASTEYPGHKWCDACWPQLEAYSTNVACEGPGPAHYFNCSRFYYQSQGELMPLECEQHRPQDEAVYSAAAVGGSMFSRMKSKSSGPLLAGSMKGKMW